jgi:hypothetical protein
MELDELKILFRNFFTAWQKDTIGYLKTQAQFMDRIYRVHRTLFRM